MAGRVKFASTKIPNSSSLPVINTLDEVEPEILRQKRRIKVGRIATKRIAIWKPSKLRFIWSWPRIQPRTTMKGRTSRAICMQNRHKQNRDLEETPLDPCVIALMLSTMNSAQSATRTNDVLSIEICGPDRPQLTLVDLPGLIHSENQSQSRDDVILVSELVERYIAKSRTIILPIISAKNDYANQIILDHVRRVDPDGSRTLGIITKPDDLPPGSDSEKSFVSLARNEEKVITFKLGWHVLKNRGFKEREHTFSQRNRSEASFFSKGVWAELPRDNVGIESLRTRLSELLFEHIKKELPDLRTELDKKLVDTTKELQRLGAQRSTVGEQRQYLMKLSMSFYNIAKAGLHGHYDVEYFADKEDFKEAGEQLKVRRLRAMVQFMNKQFAARLRQYGHKYTFEGYSVSGLDSDDGDEGSAAPVRVLDVLTAAEGERPASISNGDASDECKTPSMAPRRPIVLGRREALDWVEQNLVQTRGRELAGNFNPLLIGELFWEQSKNWEDIAQKHVEEISKLCTNFVSDLLQELCPWDVYARLSSSNINVTLEQRLKRSLAELKKIIANKKLYPMTYNHYYTMMIQKLRSQRAEKNLAECIAEATHQSTYYTIVNKAYQAVTVDRMDTEKLKRLCSERITLNMDDHSCSDALDCLYAYYKVNAGYRAPSPQQPRGGFEAVSSPKFSPSPFPIKSTI